MQFHRTNISDCISTQREARINTTITNEVTIDFIIYCFDKWWSMLMCLSTKHINLLVQCFHGTYYQALRFSSFFLANFFTFFRHFSSLFWPISSISSPFFDYFLTILAARNRYLKCARIGYLHCCSRRHKFHRFM